MTERGTKRRFKSDDKRYFSIPARYRARASSGLRAMVQAHGFAEDETRKMRDFLRGIRQILNV